MRSSEGETTNLVSQKSGSCISQRDDVSSRVEFDGEDLWNVWGDVIRNWEHEIKRNPSTIKMLVKRGIPQHFRTIAWQLLSNASVSTIHEVYSDYMRQSSVFEKVILRDIPRTFPEMGFFKDGGRGQASLFNVIKAYSIHDKEVGYCQGSAFIAGLLLMQMPEEEAFAVIVRLMENYRLRELYKPAMTELGLCIFQLDCLVQEQMPDLYTHFNNMGLDTSMYASSWFLTLFTTTMPIEIANRIMDCFFLEGMEFIFCVAMSILQQARVDLLRLDMEGMLKYFQRDVRERYECDADLLFAVASKVQLNPRKMRKLEKDYLTKRTKDQEEAVELRRLRMENRLFRQRIDYLEAESAALADRLVKGQVNLAQEAEYSINIAHELSKLRDINSDAHRRLEDAYDTIRKLTSCHQGADAVVQVDDTSMIEHIHSLQHELIESHNRQADYEEIIRECKIRIADLEAANKRLREHELFGGITILQDLQEELISVKMREAESNLAVKEMRQRLDELEQYWAKYVHARMSDFSYSTFSSDSTAASSEPSSPIPLNLARSRFAKITAPFVGTSSDDGDDYIAIRKLEDQLMGVRIKEAVNMAELKEMRQKVMKLETQRLVCTNRIRQQIDEMKRVRKELEAVQKAGSICNEPNGDLFSVGSENMIALLAKIVVNIPVLDDIAEEQSSSENKEMYDGSDTSNCDVPNS
uniref:Rab-GAP TBC domain-containing protein n=1 Tax=Haemonchus contortus TaxID=6289 RepID=A0A7I4Z227_HAECO